MNLLRRVPRHSLLPTLSSWPASLPEATFIKHVLPFADEARGCCRWWLASVVGS